MNEIQVNLSNIVSGIDKHKEIHQILAVTNILVDKPSEFVPALSVQLCIAISGEIYQIPIVINQKVIHHLGLTRSGRSHRQPGIITKHIYKAGLTHITAADKGKFRKPAGRSLLSLSAASGKCRARYLHTLFSIPQIYIKIR